MIEKIDVDKQQSEADIKRNIALIDKGLKDRDDPKNKRPAKLKKVDELRLEIAKKREKLNLFMRCDDAKVQEMKNSIYISREACNRWCDNMYMVKEWMLSARPDISFRELISNFPGLKTMSLAV